MIVFPLSMSLSCRQAADDNTPVEVTDSSLFEPAQPADEAVAEPVPEAEETVVAEPVAPAKTNTSTANTGRKETLYISTYGANGKVWGHVTMNGNTGRGTIHDEGENSLSITVTRHGGELFGTDQNGRQYVFTL